MSVTPEERAQIVEETNLYWRNIIALLAQTQAATAERAALMTRTGKLERTRQALICWEYLHVLEGEDPRPDSRYSQESAIKRLRSCIDLLEQP